MQPTKRNTKALELLDARIAQLEAAWEAALNLMIEKATGGAHGPRAVADAAWGAEYNRLFLQTYRDFRVAVAELGFTGAAVYAQEQALRVMTEAAVYPKGADIDGFMANAKTKATQAFLQELPGTRQAVAGAK